MLKEIKKFLAFKYLQFFYKRENEKKNFVNELKKLKSFLVILPESEVDAKNSLAIINYLDHSEKKVLMLINSVIASSIISKNYIRYEEYFEVDKNFLGLPKKEFLNKFKIDSFDAIIDLNREENTFSLGSALMINSHIKIGFTSKRVTWFYDFQFHSEANDSEKSYKNFLNCLKMF
ncbi:MAG: hypothetical protein C0425_02360 [Chlorobiaceae bacterium]|nr:hypothetical protein [Chlorobiaceae bacterium]MBA4309163.1 hypothetical protein [Chlorobiaceae bacterium]